MRNGGERINSTDIEVEANVMIAKATGVGDVQRIEELGIIAGAAATYGVVVVTFTPGEVVLGVQAMPVTLIVRSLQAVVLRGSQVSCLDDVFQSGKRGCEGPVCEGSSASERTGVEIAIDDQVLAALSRISQSQNVIGEHLLLNAEIEVVRSRCFEVGHDGKRIEWRLTAGARTEDRSLAKTDVVTDLSDGVPARSGRVVGVRALIGGNRDGKASQIGLREGTGSGPSEGVGRSDGAEIRDVIGQRVAAAKKGLAVLKNAPGETRSGPEVTEITVIKTVDTLTELHQAPVREKVRAAVLPLAQSAVDLVTQAVGESEARVHLPLVLCVEADGFLDKVATGVPKISGSTIRATQEKFLDGVLDVVAAERNVAQKETSPGTVAQTIGVGVLKVAAEFNSVVIFDPREVLGPIPSLVRPGGDRVALDASDVATISEGSEINVGHTKIDGRERSGIHAQALGVNLVVHINDLGKAGIAQSAFQNLIVANAPSPAQAGHLRAGRCYGIK